MDKPNFALSPSVVDIKQYEKSIAIPRKHEETYAAFLYIHSFAGVALFVHDSRTTRLGNHFSKYLFFSVSKLNWVKSIS